MIIFTHVPKTAGTVFRKALHPHYSMFNSYPRVAPWVTHPIQPLPEGTDLVFGHFWAGCYEGEHIMLIRDPIHRAVSNYFHFVKSAKESGTNLLMQAIERGEVSLRDWVMGNGPGDAIWQTFPQERPWNVMSRWIAGMPDPQVWFEKSLWNTMIESAKHRFIAIADSPQKLYDFLVERHGIESFQVGVDNVNPYNEGVDALDDESYGRLLVRNEIDTKLCQLVLNEGGLWCP
jgi:hypothetical protein